MKRLVGVFRGWNAIAPTGFRFDKTHRGLTISVINDFRQCRRLDYNFAWQRKKKTQLMNRLILFNKPYRVLCQFTDSSRRATLADFLSIPGIYPAGRLDYESEGLLLLTNTGFLQHAISHPRNKLPKSYWVQVDAIPDEQALRQLAEGVQLKDGRTRPAEVHRIEPPAVWPRPHPIRERKAIPTAWLSLTLTEGRNRQVRRMTAAVGHPTLRLIRQAVGPWHLGGLQPGAWQAVRCPQNREELAQLMRRVPEKDGVFASGHHDRIGSISRQRASVRPAKK